jgi:Type I phosphodiesterase / nucleotide pyrophosphatase
MDICRRTFGAALLGGLAGLRLVAAPRPRLFVLLVLEELGGDYLFSPSADLLPGGVRKLLEHGACFPDCRHYASTFSATTIATLATGAWPAQHGIVADYWFDRATKKVVPAGEEALDATTLAAQASGAHARVYTVADSANAAGLVSRGSDGAVFWMDNGGQFTARGEPREWLEDFNAKHSPENLHNAKWVAVNAKPDAPALRTLAYNQNHPGEFQALYSSSYFAQTAPFDLLRELIVREALGQRDTLDFVTVLSRASALLGNETGSRSPLLTQMRLRLDRELEALLADLGRAVGDAGFSLALVGGHGAPPEPPAPARSRMAVNGEALAGNIAKALDANKFGAVEKYVYPFLYLDTSGWRDPESVRLAAARAALGHAAVANYYTAGGACSTGDEWQQRFRNSFHPKRSGDVMLSYRPEYVEEFGQGRGVSYGSLYNYDVSVPLFFYGPQFRAGIYERSVESIDVAPTLARAMGVELPSSSTGRVLAEGMLE